MPTIDELTMGLMQNINVDRLTEAKRNGRLITYYAEVAGRILGDPDSINRREMEISEARAPTMQDQINRLDNSPVGRSIPERIRQAITREVIGEPAAVEVRSNPSSVRPETPQPRRSETQTVERRTSLFPEGEGQDKVRVRSDL